MTAYLFACMMPKVSIDDKKKERKEEREVIMGGGCRD